MDNIEEIKIKIAGISESLTEADGTSAILWCQGCDLGCRGCQNPELISRDEKAGFWIDFPSITAYLSKYLDWIDYLVFSGGEPLLQKEAVKAIANWAKKNNKKTWLYTGRLFDEVGDDIKEVMDVIKAGPYIDELRTLDLPFRGSSNQKLYRKIDNQWKEVNK